MTYNPGQVAEIYPYLARVPGWFVIGGPADADEAQCLKETYPAVQVLGIEPCEEMRDYQRSHDFPGPIVAAALRDRGGSDIQFRMLGRRSSSEWEPSLTSAITRMVPATTLDFLDYLYGPFMDAVLWLDIEGSEYLALKGAGNLLSSGRVQLVNIEALPERMPEQAENCAQILTSRGFRLVHEWGRMGDHLDRIYVR